MYRNINKQYNFNKSYKKIVKIIAKIVDYMKFTLIRNNSTAKLNKKCGKLTEKFNSLKKQLSSKEIKNTKIQLKKL